MVLALLAVGLLSAAAGAPERAFAVISPATTIDGSDGVIDVGGVAMAEDGTGGIVYRKRAEGRAHIYAAQLVRGRWRPPQRIDVGQAFDSSWPRIGAANDGRLVVTWVQEFGIGSDRLFSASLDPGATRFQAPVPIDLNVGEAVASYPSLAMNSGGSANIAYRVLAGTGAADPNAPPGYFDAEVRVARYNGYLWSGVGQVADRNPGAPVATPTAANSPKVGIDVSGNGIVAFHEPDDDFVDRVWARRVFGSSFGIPLLVSPQQHAGRPLRGPADAFALDVTGFGTGAVAFRQQPGPSGALEGAHVYVNLIPEAFRNDALAFLGPRFADGTAGGPLPATPSAPGVGVTPDGAFRVTYSLGAAARTTPGGEARVDPPVALGDGRGVTEALPVVEVAETEAAVAAWRARLALVGIQESRADGKVGIRGVSAAGGGAVQDVQIAGSNLGDALVGFLQGDEKRRQVAASTVDAPPLDFAAQVPLKFVRSRKIRLTWDPARNALSPVRYTVTVGGRRMARDLYRTSFRVPTRRLRDGRLALRITATDDAGQRSHSSEAVVRLDRKPPRARATALGGRRLRVRIVDGRRPRVAGPSRSRISWGDGRRSRGARATHRYKRRGTYRVRVVARDRAGNVRRVKLRVRVR
jgi:PKD domain